MALWAGLIALVASSVAILIIDPSQSILPSGVLELVAAVALFTVICAAEART